MITLKEMRLKRGLSQKALAQKIGTQQPNVAVMEREPMPMGISLNTLLKINGALGCQAMITGTKIHFVEN